MSHQEWYKLAAMCADAKGPSREIEARITLLLMPYLGKDPYRQIELGRWTDADGIDAFLSPCLTLYMKDIEDLVLRLFPKAQWVLTVEAYGRDPASGLPMDVSTKIDLWPFGRGGQICTHGATSALALCSALCIAAPDREVI